MLNLFLTKLTDHWEKKCQKKMGGIPLLWVIYKEDEPIPNIYFRLHPMFAGDKVLNESFKTVAEYMRKNYLESKEASNAGNQS